MTLFQLQISRDSQSRTVLSQYILKSREVTGVYRTKAKYQETGPRDNTVLSEFTACVPQLDRIFGDTEIKL